MADNPWLHIPASDYETHMASSHVGQAAFLSDLFRRTLEQYPCGSVALLGCATGNGLEHVDIAKTSQVTAIDINPDYLRLTRERFGNAITGLETVAGDLSDMNLEQDAYDLVFAGLVFEYVKPEVLLSCGLNRMAARAGDRVRELAAEITVATAMVMANCR